MNSTVDQRGRPRIVITGIGAITPVGNTPVESWENLLAGNSGICRITQFDPSDLPTQIAGEIKGFDPRAYMNHKDARRMSRASQLGVAVAKQAVEDAGLSGGFRDPERVGVVMGTAMGGWEKGNEGYEVYKEKGFARANPFALTSSLCNMPSHHISLELQTLGPINTTVAACASGTQSIGEGAELIRRGAADMVLAGGVEGLVVEAAMAGFCAMRAMPVNYNDDPGRASRPFDLHREGFILSEGAGLVVLERLDHALARGAYIYAEVLGQSTASDAHHMAIPDPEAAGAIRAMRWAIEDAGVAYDEIDYINAHGSSTPINDALETYAIKKLFGEQAYNLAVSSTKSIMGHAMGGTGTIEAIFCTYGLEKGILPPTWNFETPDPDCDLDYVTNGPRSADLRVAMSNSFGLGGQNACIVLGKYGNGHSNGNHNA
ncbi:MAG: beta-ketoacyl-ACP synthase II [Anaerolineae bacterium]|nr:beta-ketoacyl-ACP synthase II [Anaerolineae bacterium]